MSYKNNNNGEKKTFVSYFDEQEKYSKIYGDKTIVFFEMGKFYDAYCTKTKGYLKLAELEPLLNIHFIRREENSKRNPYNKPNQFGIPTVSIKKNLTTLVENGYTIVIFEQKNDGDKIKRELVGVYSPGTYISDRQTNDANYIMSVYMAEEKQLTGKKNLMAIGVTIVDITTGNSMVHEFYSNKLDDKFGLDELIRIMQTFHPTELVIYYHPVDYDETTIKNIKLYVELAKYKNSHFYVYHNKKGDDELNLLCEEMFKINNQNEYLAKIYELNYQVSLHNKSSPIEILQLEQKSYSIISLMIILKYIAEHNVLLLKNLSYPEIYCYNKHLILGNNAVEQLNIIDSNNLELYNQKFKSVFDVINKTSTPMGRRFLKENLLNPMSQENKNVIKKRYDIISELIKEKSYKKIKEELKNIYDMERLHRRMAMGSITPYEFYRLDSFYQATTKIISMIKDNKILRSIIPDSTIKEFMTYQIEYNKEYECDIMQHYNNFNDIDKSFFKKGIHNNLDKIQDKIDYVWSLINSTNDYLMSLISSKCKKIKNKEILEMESNDRDGYYFTITKANEKILKDELKKKKDKIRIDLSIGETLDVDPKDIIFKQLPKGRTKIFVAPLVEHTVDLSLQITRLNKLTKKIFIKSMVGYFTKYKTMMHKISKFISEMDFLVSGAIVATDYYYCKPQITTEENVPSYIKAKALRHAIIERLCNETEFVPNDIELGNVPKTEEYVDGKEDEVEKNGILLYGLNSAGKSCLMKSIGISIILAQIGYYVPAQEFIYEPYMALYARITGNDNIFKGLSSFALEMTELDAILLRTENQGPNTIVIGDEVCRGTEDTSGIAIVASALVSLSECKSTFIFSSHLHDLPKIEEIERLKNLRLFHLRVEYDETNDCLLFDRKLTPGSGPRVYGLAVAKYLIKNPKFINRAEIIKKRIMKEDTFDIPSKTSNYNKDLLVKSCNICEYSPKEDFHKELESHHIHFQKNCWEDGKIKDKPYLNKNKLYNLVVLCRKCHEKVHKGEIIIKGYADTSIGPILDYHVDIKKRMLNGIDDLEKMERHASQNLAYKKIPKKNIPKIIECNA
ncbi:putative DNA mismatch repair protein muts-like protein [Tupanvirus deep ocean]|uniref:DNA mismatch repair protein muts-like protein n=2 Tax=Tupanvirus TaxID=2094720 RepID=A0AC62A8B7_9VIRU|nr:putative DNA mismatch repair protein muts-like protein [Tupanvirus deep ocean]QKU33898.1 putative DNA mismatch repair protein muts-like protein [Tupanvirus deep ocean]